MQTFQLTQETIPYDQADIFEAFKTLASSYNGKATLFSKQKFIVHLHPLSFFNKIYKAIYIDEKLPIINEGLRSRMTENPSPLPTLFIGREKTQVRQIPLAHNPPWPFHFLLELGGMVVAKTENKRELYESLRQFINNHPQFDIMVDAKECPDGSIAILTYWFKEVPKHMVKENVNVPH